MITNCYSCSSAIAHTAAAGAITPCMLCSAQTSEEPYILSLLAPTTLQSASEYTQTKELYQILSALTAGKSLLKGTT